jgi:hypothetical protein
LQETVRRHLVSGTGDADSQTAWRVFRWAKRTFCAAPWARKKKEEMAAQRAKFMAGCAKNKINEKKAEKIFNLMEEFRRLRVQQVALLRLRAAGLSDRVHEDALSGRIHRRAADFGNRQRREGREVHQRSARNEHFDLAAGL